MKRGIMLILAVGLPLGVGATPEIKGDPDDVARYLIDDKKTVILYGYGEERIYAGSAVVSLIIKTKEAKLSLALEQNNAVRNYIKQKLTAGGIAAENVQSSRFSSMPSYSAFKDKPTNYEIANEVKVTVFKEEELHAVAEIVDNVDQVYFSKTEIKDSSRRDSQDKAMDKAMKNVVAKKRAYEENLGVTLIPLRVIDQASVQEGIAAPSSKFSSGDGLSSMSVIDSKGYAPQGRFGEIIYQSNIGVTYLVKAR